MTVVLSQDDVRIISRWTGHEPDQVEADPRLLEMGRLLIRDSLTGVYNRRYFMARVGEAIQHGPSPVVAILDLDGFKQVNDSLGHDMGDLLLQAIALRVQEALPRAVVARLGGDEFGLLFADEPLDSAALALERLLRQLPRRWDELGISQTVHFSAGLAAWPEDGHSLEALLRGADRALYAAKRAGKQSVRLARHLEAEPLPGRRSMADSVPLVGRAALWEALQQRLAEAGQGRGGVLLLRGPSGVGKSRLLHEAALLARGQGWKSVYSAPAGDGDGYAPLHQWLAELGSAPARSYGTAGRRLDLALRQAGPVCLLVDDLPRADLISLFALRQVGAGLLQRPVLVIATVNPEQESSDGWLGLQAEGDAAGWLSVLEVGGLARADIDRLAMALLRAPLAPEALEELFRLTEGNPLHAIALLHLWSGAEAILPGPAGWELRPERLTDLPVALRQVLIRWMHQLPLEVRDLIGLLAVLGNGAERGLLARLSGAGEDELADWESRAVMAQVLQPDGGSIRFTHPLLQEAAYTCLSPQARRLAHRVAGELLEAEKGTSAAALARHFEGAGLVARAFPCHVAAGDQALAAHDTRSARHHLRRAWVLLPVSVGDEAYRRWYGKLALRLAQVTRRGGDPGQAADLCQEVLRHRSALRPTDVLPLLLEWGESSRVAGRINDAEEAWRQAERLVGSETPDTLRLEVGVLGLRFSLMRAVLPEHLEQGLALAAEAQRLGHRRLQGELSTLVCAMLLQRGRQAESEAWNRRAIPLLPFGSSPDASVARMRAGLLATTANEARRWLREALLAAAAADEIHAQARLLRILGNLERGAGNWQAARHYYEQSLHLCGRRGIEMERDRALYELAVVQAWSGRVDEALAVCTSVAESSQARGDRIAVVAARGRLAQALLVAGRPARAVEALAPVDEWLSPTNAVAREQRINRAHAYLRLGDLRAAREQMESILDWDPVLETAAHRGMVCGAILRAAGEPLEALSWLEKALALRGRPFVELHYLAHAQVERALALHELGRAREAGRAWRRAEQDFQRLGAEPGLAAARQRWEAARRGSYR